MRKLSKGYAKFAFMLLVLAMCMTAFVVSPYYNTKTYAYVITPICVTNKTEIMSKWEYSKSDIQAIEGSDPSLPQKTFDHFFNPNLSIRDALSGYIYFAESDKQWIVGNNDFAVDSYPGGVGNDYRKRDILRDYILGTGTYWGTYTGMRKASPRYMPNYYDLVTGAGGSTLSASDFPNGTTTKTISLGGSQGSMKNYFGLGFGITMSWGVGSFAEGTNGTNYYTTFEDSKIYYYTKSEATTNKPGAPPKVVQDWRRSNGFMYTFIKVPKGMSQYLSVSASADMMCQKPFGENNGNDCRSLVVLDVQVGNYVPDTNNPTPKHPGALNVKNSTQYVSPDTAAGAVNWANRQTGFVDLDGSEWIQLSATVVTSDANYLGGYKNEMGLSNVKLTFKVSPKIVEVDIPNNGKDDYFPSKDINITMGYNSNLNYDSSSFNTAVYRVDPENPSNLFLVAQNLPKNSETNVGDNKKQIKFTHILTQNGTYEVRILRNGEVVDKVRYATPVKAIDKLAPNYGDWAGDSVKWFTSVTTDLPGTKISLINVKDQPATLTDCMSKVDKISFYLKKIDDSVSDTHQYNFSELYSFANSATNDYKYEVMHSREKFSSQPATMFPNVFGKNVAGQDKYGKYVLFYKVTDKAGNWLSYNSCIIKYDNGANYSFADGTLQLSTGATSGWKDAATFGNSWINGGDVYVKFKLSQDYHFTPSFTFTDEGGTEYSTLEKDENGNNLIKYTKDGLTFEGLIVEAGYYYAKFSANNLETAEDYAFDGKIYATGEYADRFTIASGIPLKIDVKKPFTAVPEGELFLDFNNSGWFTFDSYVYANDPEKGAGIWLSLNTDLELMELDVLKDAYVISNTNGGGADYKTKLDPEDGIFKVFLPLNKGINPEKKLYVKDQAGNVTEITLPEIKFDSTKYRINTASVSHSNLGEDAPNVTFLVGENKESAATYTLDELITTPLYRGLNVYVNFEGVDVNLFGEYSVKLGETNLTVENNMAQFAIGDGGVTDYNLDVIIYKYINIKVYVEGKELSTSGSDVVSVDYNGKDKTFVVKDENGNDITSGITGITATKNAGNYDFDIEVNDAVNKLKTKEVNKYYLQIKPKSVNAVITSKDSLTVSDGTLLIENQYGKKDPNFNVEYRSGLIISDSTLEMKFVANLGGELKDLSTLYVGSYDLEFVSATIGETIDKNYTFNYVYNGQKVNVKYNVIPREVRLDLSNIPTFSYGGVNGLFDLSEVAKTLNPDDISELVTKPDTGLGFNGQLRLVDRNGAGIQYNSPVGTYYISAQDLTLKDKGENFKLVAKNNKDEWYGITLTKKVITLTVSDKMLNAEYGTALDLTTARSLSFKEGLVSDDNIEDVLNKIELKNASNYSGLLNAGKYTLEYSLKENAVLKNYDVQFATYELNIKPKKLYVRLNVAESTLEKYHDGLPFEDYSKLVPDIKNIEGFVDINDYKNYDFTNATLAFKIEGRGLDIGKYKIVAVEGYDGKVMYTGSGVRNYEFVPETDYEYVVKAQIVGDEYTVIAEFTKPNFSFTYSEFVNSYTSDLLSTLKFTTVGGNAIDMSGELAKLQVYYEDSKGDEVNIQTANVGTLFAKVRYMEGTEATYTVADYSAKSTRITVQQKHVTLKYNANKFSLKDRGGFYAEFTYGFEHTKENINDLFSVADNTGVIKGTVSGNFLLNATLNKNNLYNASTQYTFDFDNANITFSDEINAGVTSNYVISVPNESNYFIRVNPRGVTVSMIEGDSQDVGKEYGNNDNLSKYGYYLNNLVLGEQSEVKFTAIRNLERVLGEDAGEYDFIVFGYINNANYTLLRNEDGSVQVYNKYVISERIIVVNQFYFNSSKVFDNTTSIGAYGTYQYKNAMDNGVDIDKVVRFEGELDNVNVGNDISVVFRLLINPEYAKNFKFERPNGVTVNGVVDNENIFFDENDSDEVVLNNQKVNVLIATIDITIDNLSDTVLEKEYDGTTNYNLAISKKDYNSETFKQLINDKLSIKALFAQIDAGSDINVEFTIEVMENIANFNSNVKVTLNGSEIAFTGIQFKNNYKGNINPAVIKATDDSIVTKIFDGEATINDEAIVNIKPFTYGSDSLELNVDRSSIVFNSVNNGDYELNVKVTVAAYNPNYTLDGDTIKVKGRIFKRDVTIKMIEGKISEVSKVYDGKTSLGSVTITGKDYEIEGLLPIHEGVVTIDTRSSVAEFEDKWAGTNKKIILRNVDITSSDNNQTANNYNLVNGGEINGLKGTITPRPVKIDTGSIVIYNTTYLGKNCDNYPVSLVRNLLDQTTNDRVNVYMSLVVGKDGLLQEDRIYEIMPEFTLKLKGEVTGNAQSIYLDKNNGLKSYAKGVSDEEKLLAQNSYAISNLNDVFAASNGELNKGRNAVKDSSITVKGAQTYIYPFIITNADIYFNEEYLNKTYDGDTKLNERLEALVRRTGYDFLKEEINGITIKNKGMSVYNDIVVGSYKIQLELSKDLALSFSALTKSPMYDFAKDFNFVIEKDAKITERIVNVNAIKKVKTYDGTTEAKLGTDFELKLMFGTTGKQEGLRDDDAPFVEFGCTTAYYDVKDATKVARLTLTDLYLIDKPGYDVAKNYKIVFIEKSGKQSDTITLEDCEIAKRDLTIEVPTLELTYRTGLPTASRLSDLLKNKVKTDGFVAGDYLPSDFNSRITFKYTDAKKYTEGKVLGVNSNQTNGNAITIELGDQLLNDYNDLFKNYKINVKNGGIKINAMDVTVTFDRIDSKMTSVYGNTIDKNGILNQFVFKNGDVVLPQKDLIGFITINNMPNIRSDVQDYQLGVMIRKYTGIENYNITVEIEDADLIYTITPTDIEYSPHNTNFTFTYEQGKNYVGDVKARFSVTNVDKNNPNITISILMGKMENGSFVEDKTLVIEDMGVYEGLAVKIVVNGTNNYNSVVVPVKVEITAKEISLDMKNYSTTFDPNGGAQIYPDEYSSIPSVYKNVIKTFIIDESGNAVSKVTAVGKYTVVAYSTDAKVKVVERYPSGFDVNKLSASLKDLAKNGFAIATFNVNKIEVNVFVENTNFMPSSNVDAILNEYKQGIRLDSEYLTVDNIKLPDSKYFDFTKVGYQTMKLTLVGQDTKGNDVSNYKLNLKTGANIFISTNRIDDKNGNWTITSIDGKPLEENLVNNGITLNKGSKADVLTVFRKDVVSTNKEVIKSDKVNYIARVDGKLTETVNMKINVTGANTKKNLYLINDYGVCTKIENVKYVTEGGKTFAVFESGQTGWFVFADAAPNQAVIWSGVAIGVMSAIIVGLIVVLVIGLKRKKKLGIK